jgi:uncharacterized membrane protein YeaQ/YmgE (transglycosylase-associated protein family)
LFIFNLLTKCFYYEFIVFFAGGSHCGLAGWEDHEGRRLWLTLKHSLGVVGGLVGNWVFGLLGVSVSDGIIGDVLTGGIGAILILFIASLFKK